MNLQYLSYSAKNVMVTPKNKKWTLDVHFLALRLWSLEEFSNVLPEYKTSKERGHDWDNNRVT